MSKNIINVGLDVHKESIDVGLAPEGTSEIRHYGTIGGDLASLERVVRKLTSDGSEIRIAYEAGPCGFEIYRYCKKKNIECLVVAPSRIPKQSGVGAWGQVATYDIRSFGSAENQFNQLAE